jgi:hypothetical protein
MIINRSKRFRIFCTTQTIFQGVILYTKYKRKKMKEKTNYLQIKTETSNYKVKIIILTSN